MKKEKTKRKQPLERTVKKLFALSGNICAFPSCCEPIISAEGSVVGDICHIEAAEEDGPRFNKDSNNKYRCSYENLILLCKKHHKIIDDNVAIYDVELLKKIKYQHEKKFQEKDIIKKFNEEFQKQEKYNKDINKKIDDIYDTTTSTNKVVQDIQKNLLSSFDMDLTDYVAYLETEISEEKICNLHKNIMKDDYPDYLRGIYRKEEAWIGPRGCKREDCTIETTLPQDIEQKMKEFISDWNNILKNKKNISSYDNILNLAKLHYNFLKIHPFYDGNGRVSRVILMAQVFQLENKYIKNPFFNKNDYFRALKEANNNNYKRLINIICNAYFEAEILV
ncbi:Fic family protein [bacterium]|nr:Fic family protein [bacterium]